MEVQPRPSSISLPPIERLLGAPADTVEPLIDYGYRGAWRVRVRGDAFMVKSDARPGFQLGEVKAQTRAGNAGVPVPEIVSFIERPVPSVAMCWVPGVSLRALDHPEAWRDAGRVLRLAHSAGAPDPSAEPWSDLMLRWFNNDLRYLVEHRGLENAVAADAIRRAEELRPELDARTLVWLHGDCQADHVLIDPATMSVTAVIDWADAADGDPVMDFATLTLRNHGVLPRLLEGYGATGAFRRHLDATLLFYRALRGGGVTRWLDEHGYAGEQWPLEAVREFARQP